jgi:cell fate (sporulation/competence/biofilm development) regulator YlbF (YheA/YmcA/DUF963 family)
MLNPTIPTLTLTDQVRDAVNVFADALAETREFEAFQQAALQFERDPDAQQAVRVFQEKQRSLQMMQQLGMLSDEELNELRRLRRVMVEQPRVRAYLHAQDLLKRVCQLAAQEISAEINLDFAGACAPGCCG